MPILPYKMVAAQASARSEAEDFIKRIEKIERKHHISFDINKPLGQQLFILMESIMMSVKREEAEKAGMVPAHAVREVFNALFPIEYYENLILLPFEFLEVPVPLHYDEMLKKTFGDYMKPYRAGGTHNYPFYADQEEFVFEQTGYIAWEKYKYKKQIDPSHSGPKQAIQKMS